MLYRYQIQHPRSRLDRFDLVVTPRHDYYALTATGQQEVPRLFRRWITPQEPPRSNVVCCFPTLRCKIACTLVACWFWTSNAQVLTVGALHQADSAALRLAAIAWHDELAPLPKPLLVVNIGGPTSNTICLLQIFLHMLVLFWVCCRINLYMMPLLHSNRDITGCGLPNAYLSIINDFFLFLYWSEAFFLHFRITYNRPFLYSGDPNKDLISNNLQ